MNEMMGEGRLRGTNAIYRIIVVAAFLVGIRTAAGFISYIKSYGAYDTTTEAELAMENFVYLGLFCLCIIAAFVLNVVSMRYVVQSSFIVRTIIICMSFIAALSSTPAMLVCALVSLAKMEGEIDILKQLYSSELYMLLDSEPEFFYAFILAIVLIGVLAVATFATQLVTRRRSGGTR